MAALAYHPQYWNIQICWTTVKRTLKVPKLVRGPTKVVEILTTAARKETMICPLQKNTLNFATVLCLYPPQYMNKHTSVSYSGRFSWSRLD